MPAPIAQRCEPAADDPASPARWPAWLPASAASLVMAVFFVVWFPHDNDLLASFARESAAEHGVGLTYWFSWFGGGTTPGQYSLLAPFITVALGVPQAAAVAAVATTVLTYRATRGLPHAQMAVWVATAAAWLNVWSGRVAFGLGCVALVAVCILVRERRAVLLAVASLLSAALSPVTGVFAIIGLTAVVLTDASRRRAALLAGCLTGCLLLGIALFFGQPGPQPYRFGTAASTVLVLLAYLIARPGRVVKVAIAVSATLAVLATAFPNGLGSNISRIALVCLPAAVVAGSTRSKRLIGAAIAPALVIASVGTVGGLIDSRQPAEQYAYYAPLGKELRALPDIANYRLEVVQDGSVHMNAYALLPVVALARGWETQADYHYNAVLLSQHLNAHTYRNWLDNNAVGYVAFAHAIEHDDREHALIATGHLRFLRPVWTDARWTLYRVRRPVPIVAAPGRVVRSGQAAMTVRSPCACRILVRIRYSKFLQADPLRPDSDAQVRASGEWVTLTTSSPGLFTLHGSLAAPFR